MGDKYAVCALYPADASRDRADWGRGGGADGTPVERCQVLDDFHNHLANWVVTFLLYSENPFRRAIAGDVGGCDE